MNDKKGEKDERRFTALSDEDLERIADRVRAKVLQDLYIQIGKGTLKTLFYVLGSVAAALWAWFVAWEHWFK